MCSSPVCSNPLTEAEIMVQAERPEVDTMPASGLALPTAGLVDLCNGMHI